MVNITFLYVIWRWVRGWLLLLACSRAKTTRAYVHLVLCCTLQPYLTLRYEPGMSARVATCFSGAKAPLVKLTTTKKWVRVGGIFEPAHDDEAILIIEVALTVGKSKGIILFHDRYCTCYWFYGPNLFLTVRPIDIFVHSCVDTIHSNCYFWYFPMTCYFSNIKSIIAR